MCSGSIVLPSAHPAVSQFKSVAPAEPDRGKQTAVLSCLLKDRARVVGGANLTQGQIDLANQFVQRAEFTAKYPLALDGPGFVDAILLNIKNDTGVDLTGQRTALIALYTTGGRGAVVYRLADDNATNPINNHAFIDAEYNRAFVATQYFGYLRREPDMGGFLFWLDSGQQGAAPRCAAPACYGLFVHNLG